jgi:hypothetical protein
MQRSGVSKNRHRHHPPHRLGTEKDAWEAPSNLYELTYEVWGPTGHVPKHLM